MFYPPFGLINSLGFESSRNFPKKCSRKILISNKRPENRVHFLHFPGVVFQLGIFGADGIELIDSQNIGWLSIGWFGPLPIGHGHLEQDDHDEVQAPHFVRLPQAVDPSHLALLIRVGQHAKCGLSPGIGDGLHEHVPVLGLDVLSRIFFTDFSSKLKKEKIYFLKKPNLSSLNFLFLFFLSFFYFLGIQYSYSLSQI